MGKWVRKMFRNEFLLKIVYNWIFCILIYFYYVIFKGLGIKFLFVLMILIRFVLDFWGL